MELVYLWIEKYKNIENEEFNFSPRFTCSYKNNQLTITDKEKTNEYYLKNFFGDNININAIVGENGSGKTSIIEQLILLFYTGKKLDVENNNKSWLLTYDRSKELLAISCLSGEDILFNEITINNKILEKNSIQENNGKYYFSTYNKPKNFNIYYNPSAELVSSFFLNHIHDDQQEYDGSIYDLDFKPNELNIFALPSKKNRIIDIKKNENNTIIVMYKALALMDKKITKSLEALENSKINFLPLRVKLEIDKKELEKQIYHEYMNELVFTNYCDLGLENLYKYFIMLILSKYSVDYKSGDFKEYFFDNDNIQNFLKIRFNKAKKSISSGMEYAYIMKKMSTDIYENINEFIGVMKKNRG